MRTRITMIVAALAVFGLAGSAKAVSVSMVWESSGTATLTATGTQTADLVLLLQPGDTLVNIAFSMLFDNTTSSFVGATTVAPLGWTLLGGGGTGAPQQEDPPGQLTQWAIGNLAGPTFNLPNTFDPNCGPAPAPGCIIGTVTFSVSSLAGQRYEPGFFSTAPADEARDESFNLISVQFNAGTAIPEPGTLALMGLGLAVLGFAGRRR